MCQVSRFDPWKDPMGVIDAYRMVKEEMPEVQLALVGSMATDDPEGWEFFNSTMAYADGDPDIHILNNLNSVGAIEVNAFQSQADVVIQKSTREGFGLTVSEALWKGAAVHRRRRGRHPAPGAGRRDRLPRLLARGVRRARAEILREPDLGKRLGRAGKEHVRTALPHAPPAARLAEDLPGPQMNPETAPRPRLEPRPGHVRGTARRRARRRRARHGADGAGAPPRRGLGRVGDDRRGRRGGRSTAAARFQSSWTAPATGSGWSSPTRRPTTASTTWSRTRCCGSSSTTSGTSRTRRTSAATRSRPTSRATARSTRTSRARCSRRSRASRRRS